MHSSSPMMVYSFSSERESCIAANNGQISLQQKNIEGSANTIGPDARNVPKSPRVTQDGRSGRQEESNQQRKSLATASKGPERRPTDRDESLGE
jgi:hypothetical protein